MPPKPEEEPSEPRLQEEMLTVETEPVPGVPFEIATVVQLVDLASRELTVSVDSADEADRDMALVVADDVEIEALHEEQALIATVSLAQR